MRVSATRPRWVSIGARARLPSFETLAPVVLPFLVGLAPVMYLWSANASDVRVSDVLPVIGLVLAATGGAVLTLALITGDARRSAISVAVMSAPALTFGYQRDAVAAPPVPTWLELALLVVNAAIVAAMLFGVWRTRPDRAATIAASIAGIFVASTIPGIVPNVTWASDVESRPASAAGGPDIYFIVLDAYGRADVLQELFDYDNTPFASDLESRGFFVAADSYANYAMTNMSLASTMTMQYLPREAVADPWHAGNLVKLSPAIGTLRRLGYQYVLFETELSATSDSPLADIRYPRGRFSSEFERTFFSTTVVGTVLASPRHDVVLDTLTKIPEVADIRGPTITVAHLVVPHPPFMFETDGSVREYVDRLDLAYDKAEYTSQVAYLNRRILELVDELLARSDQEPIIIIQGDHGPAISLTTDASDTTIHWERLAILNAMLVPEPVRAELYRSISPVNTFRVILRELFAEDLPNLPDRSFYSWYGEGNPAAVEGDPKQLLEVTWTLP